MALPWISASTTLQQNLAIVRDCISQPGGAEKFEMVWCSHKRLLQPYKAHKPMTLYQPLHVSDKQYKKMFHRLGTFAFTHVRWSMGGNDAETRPQRSDTQRVQAQYMRTLISTGQYLTVPAAAAIDDDAVADDGAAVAARACAALGRARSDGRPRRGVPS